MADKAEYSPYSLPKFLEFYLFVNPLEQQSYQAEMALIDVTHCLPIKTDLHILCYHNQRMVSQFMRQLNIADTDIAMRNFVFQTIYKAALAFKAASLQGKRKGREFLVCMQHDINSDIYRFSDSYVLELAKRIQLDVAQFQADWQSDYVRQLYLKDQKIAADMNVETTPSLVTFEHSINMDGVIVSGAITKDTIMSKLDMIVEACIETHNSPLSCLNLVHDLFIL